MRKVLLSFAALLLLASAHAYADEPSISAVRIVSGDEIVLNERKTLRLAGIHAPFVKTALVDEAAKKLRGLALGKKLALLNSTTDRYGRTAADVYAADDKQKIWLQGEMLKAGLAFVYDPAGHDPYLADMLKIESAARAAHRGIWADAAYADQKADDNRMAYGRYAFVAGKVLKAERVKNMVYLNFGDDWHRDFTVTIRAGDLRGFKKAGIDPLDYEGKILRVRGWVRHEYRPEIAVTNPGQIDVLASSSN